VGVDQPSSLVASPPAQAPQQRVSAPPWRIGVIGLGAHGLAQIDTLLKTPGRWAIDATVDRSRTAYARFQARHHRRGVPVLSSVPELLASAAPDAILISTTAPAHVSIAEELIDGGYEGAIFLEKPVSDSLTAARRLQERISDSGWPGRMAVGFSRRSSRLYGDVRAVAGRLGGPPAIAYSHRCKLSMRGSHYIDLADWIVGSEPVSVSARLESTSAVDHRGAAFFDPGGVVDVEYANGARLHLDTTGAGDHAPGLTVKGPAGEIHVDVAESHARASGPEGSAKLRSDKRRGGYNWFENALLALLSGEGPAPCPLDDAVTCLEIVTAAHVSSRLAGEPVSLPLAGAALDLRVA
jgi:predicted dehydrogenase